MALEQFAGYSFKHQDSPAQPTTDQRANFDKRGDDIATYIKSKIVDVLNSTAGAGNIGATVITGLSPAANTVQLLIAALKTYSDDNFISTGEGYTKEQVDALVAGVILGQVPDGSITDVKLSNASGQIKDSFSTLSTNFNTYKAEVDKMKYRMYMGV